MSGTIPPICEPNVPLVGGVSLDPPPPPSFLKAIGLDDLPQVKFDIVELSKFPHW